MARPTGRMQMVKGQGLGEGKKELRKLMKNTVGTDGDLPVLRGLTQL